MPFSRPLDWRPRFWRRLGAGADESEGHWAWAIGDEMLVTATGSSTARLLRDRFADVVNVKDFGAKGDGVTDDTAAIDAAMALAGKRTIFFPPGVYKRTTTLSLGSEVTVRGAGGRTNGYGASVLLHTGAGVAVQVSGASFTRISDLQIDTSGTDGLLIQDSQYVIVENVHISGNPARGIHLASTTAAGCYMNRLEHVRVVSATMALVLDATAPGWTNLNFVRDAFLRTSVAAGGTVVALTLAQANSFYDVDASNYGTGAAISFAVNAGSHTNSWHGGYVEGPNATGFTLASGVQGTSIFGLTNNAQTARVVYGGGNANTKILDNAGAGDLTPRLNALQVAGQLLPATPAWATQAGSIYMGSGVPNNANGNDGDIYFRTDTPAIANQRLYVKSAGAWVGIL